MNSAISFLSKQAVGNCPTPSVTNVAPSANGLLWGCWAERRHGHERYNLTKRHDLSGSKCQRDAATPDNIISKLSGVRLTLRERLLLETIWISSSLDMAF